MGFAALSQPLDFWLQWDGVKIMDMLDTTHYKKVKLKKINKSQ